MINTTKDRWSALSLKDRADLIKLYTNNGITNIKDIRKHYNSFATGGPTEELEPSVIVDNSSLREEAKSARDWVIDYYKSEGYKQRAKKAGLSARYPLVKSFGIFPKKKLEFLENESIDNSYNQVFPVIGLQESEDSWTGDITNDVGFVTAHEFAHYNKLYNKKAKYQSDAYLSPFYGNDYKKVPGEYMNALGVNYDSNAHDSEMSESYSDLVGLRYLLDKYGIYNSKDPNTKFKYEDYKKIKSDPKFKNNRFLKLHDEQQVIKAINDVAFLENTENFDNLS